MGSPIETLHDHIHAGFFWHGTIVVVIGRHRRRTEDCPHQGFLWDVGIYHLNSDLHRWAHCINHSSRMWGFTTSTLIFAGGLVVSIIHANGSIVGGLVVPIILIDGLVASIVSSKILSNGMISSTTKASFGRVVIFSTSIKNSLSGSLSPFSEDGA